MKCKHGINQGERCEECPDNVASTITRKRSASVNRLNNLNVDHVGGPAPIQQLPVPVPLAVRTVIPISSASSSSALHSVPLVGPANLDARQLLVILSEHLRGKRPEITVSSAVADEQAVCWNWVLMGGANSSEPSDPKLFYQYVSQSYDGDQAEIERLVGSTPGIARMLDQARAMWNPAGHRPNNISMSIQDRIHKLVLSAALTFHEFSQNAASNLKVALYYDPGPRSSGIMYIHWEFVFNNEITVTKGLGAHVKAFNGISVVPGNPRQILVGVETTSLKPDHVAVLRDFERQIADGTAAGNKRHKGGKKKEEKEREVKDKN
jgi:hypothetical protein